MRRFWVAILTAGLSLSAFAKEDARPARGQPSKADAGPRIGAPAPAFTLDAFPGGKTTLASFSGKWLVLVFYPKAFAPKDVAQMSSLSQAWQEIKALNATVLGVSMDPPAVTERFGREQNLPFPLASDTTKDVTAAYGANGIGNLYSSRIAFLINPRGILAGTIERCPEKAYGKRVVETLKSLQAPASPPPAP